MSRFLARWSRLKKVAAEAPASGEGLDPEKLLAELGPDSDFGAFLREEVSEGIRRQAMKKLFADPHFNVMDGLDTYIDDYSIEDPIPAEMLASLNQARGLLFDAPPETPLPTLEAAPAEPLPAGEETPPERDILSGAGQIVPAEPPAENDTTSDQ